MRKTKTMFQTFSQAWGIKPKVEITQIPYAIAKTTETTTEKTTTEKAVAKPATESVERTEKIHDQPVVSAQKSETLMKPGTREIEKEESVSLSYHKQIVFGLFILNIVSLLIVFLIIMLK